MIKTIDLCGEWRLALSDEMPTSFGDTISLPDTLSHAQKCAKNDERCTGYMTDTYKYEGTAWFEREFSIDEDYANVNFFMERTRITTVFLDGKKLGTRNSLLAPHVYKLDGVKSGKHTLLVCVKNTGYPTGGGHLTSPDTQTNWLGITGKIELRVYGKAYAENVMIFSDIEANSVTVTADIIGSMSGKARIFADEMTEITSDYSGGKLTAVYSMGAEKSLWSEYEHNLFTINVDIDGDIARTDFGMRKISSDGLKLLVNGKQVFLRGKHDGLVFPNTGFAPTDVASWIEVMQTAKSYGINHYRFHTCCPPDAAFTAADMLGIYMEPELPFWGTITVESDENHNAAEQEYLISLGFDMLREYGNHPSFVMMSMGNELWGSHDRLNEIIRGFKSFDNRHFYTSGSNNFQFYPAFLTEEDFWSGVRFDRERLIRGSYAMCDAPLGHIQTNAPNSDHNYDETILPRTASESTETGAKTVQIQFGTGVKTVSADAAGDVLVPNIPVLSHEVGQYGMYPDFNEGKLYTGSIKPLYLDVFRERLEEKGLFKDWQRFFEASCKLAVDCYKREIEAAIGSRNLSGFQLLDLQDFPGQGVALVGVLNPLMQNKGAVTPKRWHDFCSDTVLLARTSKFVYKAGEKIKAEIMLSCCSYEKMPRKSVAYIFSDKKAGCFKIPELNERLTSIGSIELDTSDITEPIELTLIVRLEASNVSNRYSFYIYPEIEVEINKSFISCDEKKLVISHTVEEARKLAADGVKTLLVPVRRENDVDGTYCTDFWNYPMFASISRSLKRPLPTGTMGLCIDNENEVMKRFLSSSYTTPQWFEFVSHAHCANLDGVKNVKIIAEAIDNVERCSRLGMLYELDGIPVCTSRLWEISDNPEIRTLASALVRSYT